MLRRVAIFVIIAVIVINSNISFAQDYDIKDKLSGDVKPIFDILFDQDLFFEVAFNKQNYLIEFQNDFYELKVVQAKFDVDPNAVIGEALNGITPYVELYIKNIKIGEVDIVIEDDNKISIGQLPDIIDLTEVTADFPKAANIKIVYHGGTASIELDVEEENEISEALVELKNLLGVYGVELDTDISKEKLKSLNITEIILTDDIGFQKTYTVID